jgi:hypothetical protein
MLDHWKKKYEVRESKSLLESVPEKYRADLEWMLQGLYIMHVNNGLSMEEADVRVRRSLGVPQPERTRRNGQTPILRVKKVTEE